MLQITTMTMKNLVSSAKVIVEFTWGSSEFSLVLISINYCFYEDLFYRLAIIQFQIAYVINIGIWQPQGYRL